MSGNKTTPTDQSVTSFLEQVSDSRRGESQTLIAMMQDISGKTPVMWGPSIIGFGSMHYKYDSGREGDMPILAFSPRKTSLTLYFEGFDAYGETLQKLGKHKTGVGCLYINKLSDIDLDVLRNMLERSFASKTTPHAKSTTVDEYIASIPESARPQFDELRQIVRDTAPNANEVLSYGILGYKVDDKRARVFISGWKDHVAIYPIPHDETLRDQLKPYVKGKGTIWLALDEPLPSTLIKAVVKHLTDV